MWPGVRPGIQYPSTLRRALQSHRRASSGAQPCEPEGGLLQKLREAPDLRTGILRGSGR